MSERDAIPLSDRPARRRPARDVAWGVVLAGVLGHAISTHDPFPIWSGDPVRFPMPASGLWPDATAGVDLAVLVASNVLLALARAEGRRTVVLVLASLGAIAAALHAHVLPGRSLDHARLGLHWTSAMTGALAIACACRDPGLRARTWAILLGLAGALAAKSALQVFIEHPATVASYRANREAFLASQGWDPESFLARSYERRLLQPEASAWFGLSNVLASFAAPACVALVPLGVVAWVGARRREFPDGLAALVTLAGLGAMACLALAGSKAGWAFALVGTGMVLLAWMARGATGAAVRIARAILAGRGVLIGVGALALAPLAVALRGLAGEALGERSLLFRAFYAVGGLRVAFDHLLSGTGPAGFKDAYLLAKPALSPEDVDSTHAVWLDLPATLGLGGVAWLVIVASWSLMAAGALASRASPASAEGDTRARGKAARRAGGPPFPAAAISLRRPETLSMALVIALATSLSAYSEWSIATPEAALARVVGLLAWIGSSGAIALLLERRADAHGPSIDSLTTIALGGGGLTLVLHLQFDVAATWVGSSGLALAWLACAASAEGCPTPSPHPPPSRSAARAALAALACITIASGAWTAWSLVGWTSTLREAEREVEPARVMLERVEAFRAGVPMRLRRGAREGPGSIGLDTPERLLRDLGVLAEREVAFTPEDVDAALGEVVHSRAARAVAVLERAGRRRTPHAGTFEAVARLRLQLAMGADSRAELDAALRTAAEAAERFDTARSWSWLATARYEASRATGEAGLEGEAIEAWERAALLDPHSLTIPVRLARVLDERGDADGARRWAEVALLNDESLRLDPIRRLRGAEREEMVRLSRKP